MVGLGVSLVINRYCLFPPPSCVQRYSMVFLLNSDSEELEWCKSESENFPLPKSGVLW